MSNSVPVTRAVRSILSAALATTLLTTPVLAATPAATPQISAARLKQDVKTLSSDAFEGRAPATPAEQKTVDYIIAQMKAAGLKPAGDMRNGARAWTQDVPLVRASITGTPSFSISEKGQRQTLTQGEEIAVRASMVGEPTVSVENAPLVFLGYGISAPERNWDDFKGIDLKGKIGVVLINDPDFETGQGDFGGKAMTYYGRWTYKYEEAARKGALGLLIVHETDPASYGWATVKNSNTNAMFDIVREDQAAVHPLIEGWIQRDLAVSLFQKAGLDFEALKKKAQSRDFRPVPIDASFSANFNVDRSTITSKNVAGMVVGKTRPDETVLYTAHWDHLGVGEPDAKGDRIYNGAVDNATGIAALLELGRVFAKAPQPDRSVVFLAVTAEEKGLLGSEYYAANPLFPLGKTVGNLNMDALSPIGPSRDFTISGSAKLDLLDRMIADAKERGMRFTSDPHPEAGHFYRSDHFSLAKRGVPAVSFGSGEDLVNGGTAAGEAWQKAYTANAYHQPGDNFDPGWTFTGMQKDLSLLYQVGSELANSDAWPNWAEGSEFRATREETASMRK